MNFKFLPKKKAMYFSKLFGITLIFDSNFPISCIIKCESYPYKFRKITGILSVSLKFILQLLCAAPLYFPV